MSASALADTVSLMGRSFVRLTEAEVCAAILQEIDGARRGWVLTANLDILRRWVNQPEFRDLTQSVNVCVADGAPVVWASRLQGTPVPERVTGADLVTSLSAGAARKGHSIFLLGGAPGTATKAAELLQQSYPGLQIAGTNCPEFGFEKSAQALAGIREQLLATQPAIVFVALGSPKQEQLIKQMMVDLPSTWWLGIGASFSFLSGEIQRAPKWMQGVGLEWLHRLVQEPRRLFKRYLLDDLPFLLRLLSNTLVARFVQHSKSN